MNRAAWYLVIETCLVFVLVLGIHACRRRTSLVFSYSTLTFMTFASWATPHQSAINIGSLSFYVESNVFFSAALLGVFVLYVADGPRAGRMGLFVAVGTGLVYTLLALILQKQFPGSSFSRCSLVQWFRDQPKPYFNWSRYSLIWSSTLAMPAPKEA